MHVVTWRAPPISPYTEEMLDDIYKKVRADQFVSGRTLLVHQIPSQLNWCILDVLSGDNLSGRAGHYPISLCSSTGARVHGYTMSTQLG
jgi:hypothetical protein